MTAAFVGLSHLGIVTSAAWASLGEPVLGLDADADLVARLERGDLPIVEPGLPGLLDRVRASLAYAADLSRVRESQLIVIARDVPTDEAGVGDDTVVIDLVDAVMPHLDPNATLVLMSQVRPGFTREVSARWPELSGRLYYLVETLAFGDAVRRALEPERFIVGCPDPSRALPTALREILAKFGCPILAMGYESAELTKTAINVFLAGSVTYANALADLCEAVGARWWEMVPALCLDRRIGPAAYLRPSLGIAGGNIERDLSTLRRLGAARGVDTTYLDTIVGLNGRRFDWLSRQLEARLFVKCRHPTVALWGLAYKRDTDSTKNAASVRLAAALHGRARVRAWDPVVRSVDAALEVEIAPGRDEALDGADCLAIVSDWPQFGELDPAAVLARMRRPLVVDCVGALAGRSHQLSGIEYVGMGG